MKTYPRNRRTAAEVYRDTETLDAGGYFPLGLNSSWHSGIHVRSNAQDPIYPLLPGRVVALRVNDVPQEIDRLKEIPLAEYAALPPQIQALYGPLQNKDTGDCSDELQQARAIAKSYSMKELISSGPETREEFSTGFVLVRHEVPLYKKDNENKEKIVFFTLYVNLLSYTQLPCAVPPDYTPLAGMFHDKNTPLALPFYRKWLFRLSGSLPERKFFTAGGNEMYLLSHCAVKSEKCFHRALPEELICEAGDGGEAGRFTLPSRDIEIFP
ncbi:MAG: hypothetical protein LBC67_02235, partial [Spirochaetales bacterium]|nr:hypothetical protein [Spirochaetales bacterium]